MMNAPAGAATSSPAAGRLFLLRAVQLGWTVLTSLVYRALPLVARGAGADTYKAIYALIAVVWFVFAGVEIFLLRGLIKEVGPHPAAPRLRTTVGLAWVGVVISVLNLVGLLGGPDLLHFNGMLGRIVGIGLPMGIALAFDVVLWLALEQLLGDRLLPALRPAFYGLRLVGVAFGSLAMLPFELYRSLVLTGVVALILPWVRLSFTIAWNVVVLVALNTLWHSAPSAIGAGGPLAPPRESDGKTDLIVGALWLGGGLLVTLLSYNAASSSGGGHYIVTTGAIAVGVVRIVRGVVRLSRA